MRLFSPLSIATALVPLLVALAPAHGQASRTWVSGVGDDANPCSRTAPCKTFQGALSKTGVNGEINCLDPGGFGSVTITQSVTIDCTNIFGSILNAGTNGVNISLTGGTDTREAVRLRGLLIQGYDSGLSGVHINSAKEVWIENTAITGDFGGNGNGVIDTRSTPGSLYITNTSINNLGGAGIVVAASVGSTVNTAVLDHVIVQNAAYGLAIGKSNYVTVSNSTLSGNMIAGAEVDGGGHLLLNGNTITNNPTGVVTAGVTGLTGNTIAFNNVPISGSSTSFGNNAIYGNAGAGTPPSPSGLQ